MLSRVRLLAGLVSQMEGSQLAVLIPAADAQHPRSAWLAPHHEQLTSNKLVELACEVASQIRLDMQRSAAEHEPLTPPPPDDCVPLVLQTLVGLASNPQSSNLLVDNVRNLWHSLCQQTREASSQALLCTLLLHAHQAWEASTAPEGLLSHLQCCVSMWRGAVAEGIHGPLPLPVTPELLLPILRILQLAQASSSADAPPTLGSDERSGSGGGANATSSALRNELLDLASTCHLFLASGMPGQKEANFKAVREACTAAASSELPAETCVSEIVARRLLEDVYQCGADLGAHGSVWRMLTLRHLLDHLSGLLPPTDINTTESHESHMSRHSPLNGERQAAFGAAGVLHTLLSVEPEACHGAAQLGLNKLVMSVLSATRMISLEASTLDCQDTASSTDMPAQWQVPHWVERLTGALGCLVGCSPMDGGRAAGMAPSAGLFNPAAGEDQLPLLLQHCLGQVRAAWRPGGCLPVFEDRLRLLPLAEGLAQDMMSKIHVLSTAGKEAQLRSRSTMLQALQAAAERTALAAFSLMAALTRDPALAQAFMSHQDATRFICGAYLALPFAGVPGGAATQSLYLTLTEVLVNCSLAQGGSSHVFVQQAVAALQSSQHDGAALLPSPPDDSTTGTTGTAPLGGVPLDALLSRLHGLAWRDPDALANAIVQSCELVPPPHRRPQHAVTAPVRVCLMSPPMQVLPPTALLRVLKCTLHGLRDGVRTPAVVATHASQGERPIEAWRGVLLRVHVVRSLLRAHSAAAVGRALVCLSLVCDAPSQGDFGAEQQRSRWGGGSARCRGDRHFTAVALHLLAAAHVEGQAVVLVGRRTAARQRDEARAQLVREVSHSLLAVLKELAWSCEGIQEDIKLYVASRQRA